MNDEKYLRNIGTYMEKGEWGDYWRTRISDVRRGRIIVRGYPIEEIIEKLSFVEATFLLIRGELPTTRQTKLFDLALRCTMDQQFINSAACTSRYIASASPETPIPAIAGGILANGSITGSPQECAEMQLKWDGKRKQKSWTLEKTVIQVLDWYSYQGKRVPGLGHPLHKTGEPRAILLRKKALELDGWGRKGELLDKLAEKMSKKKGRSLPINLAGAEAVVMTEIGFDPLEIAGLAAVGYGMALIAHAVEEIREGVPLRIIPEALGARYIGVPERHM
jgi:citrate synthase